MQTLFTLPTIPAAIPTRNPVFTGQVTLSAGTRTAPAVGFSSDPDTGLYQPSAGLLGLTADGSEIARATAGAVSLGGVPGAEALRATQVSNAVNRVEIRGAATGAAPSIQTQGNDPDINLTLTPKGNGVVTGAGGLLKVPAVTEGQGIAGYAGGTMIWGITRLVNGPRVTAFGEVYIATGATSGPTSGSIQCSFVHTANSTNYWQITGDSAQYPVITVGGNSSIINPVIRSKSGTILFQSEPGVTHLSVSHTAGATLAVNITGAAAGGSPKLGTSGGPLSLTPATAAVIFPLAVAPPTVSIDGAVYFDTTLGKLRVRAGGIWIDLH